jgi:hypothetical protein
MIVYRIENESGCGPYFGSMNYSDWTDGFHNAATGRPMPYEDNITATDHSLFRFGFESMDKLTQWFTFAEIGRLLDQGFRVVSFQVDIQHTVIGNKQLVFKREQATEITGPCLTAELTYAPEAA